MPGYYPPSQTRTSERRDNAGCGVVGLLVLGAGFFAIAKQAWHRALCCAAMGIGFFCIYLSQLRSMLVLTGVCLIALLAFLALFVFVRVTVRYPQSQKRWVSTITILINQAQVLTLISSLRLQWPRSVELIMSALSFK